MTKQIPILMGNRSESETGRMEARPVGEISTVVFTNVLGQVTRAEYIRTNGWNCGYVLTLANGSVIMRTLERDWERPQLVTRVLTTFNGNTIRDYRYAYDILGRITNRIDNGVQMNNFIYNARSEILRALFGTNTTDYAYDDIGNHDLYPANSLNQYVNNAIEYDLDGNMTRHGTRTFGWDAENRLVTASDGTTSITNAYDYKHRRVRKTVGSESHAFVFDGWNLLGETVNDTERTHYFWGLDLSDSLQGAGGVGGLLAVSQDGAMYYPVYDNNGNVTVYLDDSGNTVASYEYNAFGETLSQSGSRADEFAFRFSTKYHDNETGLYYYGYRFYSPVLRTWLNRDPIGEDGGLNLYAFCGNNPVDRYDKLGEAYFALRPLEGAVGVPFFSRSPLWGYYNMEFSHEQLFFEDGEHPSNVGFFRDTPGEARPDKDNQMRRYGRTSWRYNDCVMRKAVRRVKPRPYSLLGGKGMKKYNCQDYASELRSVYSQLMKDKSVRKECCVKEWSWLW